MRPFVILACLFARPGGAPARQLERFDATEPHMGTLFRITLYASSDAAAQTAFADAFRRVHQLDEILSDYNPSSELSRVCQNAWQHPMRASVDLFTVLQESQRIARATGGAFDVTQGPVIRLWRQARKDKVLPDPARIAEARTRSGYEYMTLDRKARTVFLKMRGMQLDVGGIAKGYTADEALKVLRAHGITRALVAASGDLAIGDPPPGSPGWRVGIDPLSTGPNKFRHIFLLHNIAVSTAGDTEQFLETGGVRYSHIIDPKTGMGLTNRIAVTVLAKRGIEADGLDTALCVLGPGRGLDFVIRHTRVSALIVTPERELFHRRVKIKEVPQ
jgi:thiamine biosynthesis lipoprotein